MKKKVLLFLPIAFLLCSCDNALTRLSIGNWKPFGFLADKEEEEEQKDDGIHPGDVDPEEMKQHANSISLSPSAPFQLFVGQSRALSVSLTPPPTDDSEKIVEWALSGDAVEYEVSEEDTKKANVFGVKPGSATLTATNTYNRNLSKSFSITVINFDGENDYFWQYNNETPYKDLSKFDKKSGRVNLRGIEWDYTREKGANVHSGNGGVCFGTSAGKGTDPNPETRVTFEALNNRVVKSISIEASSTNSLSKMNVKVGNTTFISNVTLEKPYGNVLATYSSASSITPTAGDISIDIQTPEYSAQQAADNPNYKSPGNCCIKSIFIEFAEVSEYAKTSNYDFRAMYNNEEDTKLHTLTGTAEAVELSDEDFNIRIEKAKKSGTSEDDKIQGVALSNGYIELSLNRANEVFSMIEFQVEYGTTDIKSRNMYSVQTSRSNGAPFSNSQFFTIKDSGKLKTYVFTDNVNKVRLVPNNSNYVGLDYLKISTRAGVQATIKEVVAPSIFRATKMDYNADESFNPAGLPDVELVYNEEGVRNDYLSGADFEWYDGVSYDNNPATATKLLQSGTTYVYGVFRNSYVVKVNGIVVISESFSVSLVNSEDDITDGKYFITSPSAKRILKGSCTTGSAIFGADGSYYYENALFGDSLELGTFLANDYIKIAKTQDGKFQFFTESGLYFGLTKAGSGTASKTCPNRDFEISFENNIMTAVITAEGFNSNNESNGMHTYYLGLNTTNNTFGLYAANRANLSLYKMSE